MKGWVEQPEVGRVGFVITYQQLRGYTGRQLSKSPGTDGDKQPHKYFDAEHVHLPRNQFNSSQTSIMVNNLTINRTKAPASKVLTKEKYRSSFATLYPQTVSKDVVLSPRTVDTENVQPQAKKKKKGVKESPLSTPVRSPIYFARIPSAFPSTEAGQENGEKSIIPTLQPSNQKIFQQETNIPSLIQQSSNEKDQSSTTIGITSTLAIVVFLAVAYIFVRRGQKTIRKTNEKLNPNDLALYADASISSERSSTFQNEDDKTKGSDGQTYSPDSKTRTSCDDMSPSPGTNKVQNRKDQPTRFVQLFRAPGGYMKRKRTNRRTVHRSHDTEYFPPPSPFLVEECSPHTDVSARPILSSNIFANDEEIITSNISTHERTKWRAILDEDFDSIGNILDDHQSVPCTNDLTCDALATPPRYSISKQRSIDDDSQESVNFISPDIVSQFKTIDQRLSEGFEQYKVVEKQLSKKFDELEATLGRISHEQPTVSNTNKISSKLTDDNDVKLNNPNSDNTEDLCDDEKVLLQKSQLSKPTSSNRPSKTHQKFPQYHSMESDEYSSNDEDDRKHRFLQAQNHFASSRYQNSSQRGDTSLSDAFHIEERIRHELIVTPPPVSLLVLPKQHIKMMDDNDDQILSLGHTCKTDSDDDVLSTTEDEFNFQTIRSRFQ